MADLLYALFFVCLLALVVGLIKPEIVLDWLPEEKRNRAYVASVFGGTAVLTMIAVSFPSLLENVLFILFFASLVVLVIALISPNIVLGWLPDKKRNRLGAVLIFGTIAIFSLAMGSSASSLVEEANGETPVEQTEAASKEVDEVTAEEVAVKEAEEKAKKEAEEKAKKEAEEKAKQEAEEKAKKEAEEKAKQEAEEKAKKEAEEKAKQEAEEAKKQSETVSQQNAIRTAKDYLNFTAFSKAGLIDQLEYEGYSTADATYAVESLEDRVDWDSQAVAAAQNYLEFTSFSRSGLIDQLKYEGFTTEQATYAANQVGL